MMTKPNIICQLKSIENELLYGDNSNLNRYIELVNTRIRNLENKYKAVR